MSGLECPYCGADHFPDAEPCDCLNDDAPHDWEKRVVVVQGAPHRWQRCRQCGQEREEKQLEMELAHE